MLYLAAIVKAQLREMIMEIAKVIFMFFWVGCSFFSYGMIFAYFQRKYPTIADSQYKEYQLFAIVFSIFGPIAFLVCLIGGYGSYGLKFK